MFAFERSPTLLETYLSAPFIESMMRDHSPGKAIRVHHCEPFAIDNSASILAVLTAGRSDRPIGHFGLMVTFEAEAQVQTRAMVLKIKPHGGEVSAMLQALAAACGSPLAETYPAYAQLTGFQHAHGRELTIYDKLPAKLQPVIYGLRAEEPNRAYLILMELLTGVTLMNSVMTPDAWTDAHIRQALHQLAQWHAQHLDRPLPLPPEYWTDAPSAAYMTNLRPLWEVLIQNAAQACPDLYTPDRTTRMQVIAGAIPTYWRELGPMPKTLVHNDLNPRNTCFKTEQGRPVLCVYDWELATYHVPQYDVVELLCFVLDADRYALRQTYLAYYRQVLHQLTGRYADAQAFRRGVELAAYDFGLHRLGLYMMAHRVSPYPFLPRVVNSYFDLLADVGSSASSGDGPGSASRFSNRA